MNEKFEERLAKLPPNNAPDNKHIFTIRKARYAKNKVAIHAPGRPDSIWMSAAQNFLANKLNANYSGREHSFIVSIAQAEKFAAYVTEAKEN